MEHTDRDRNLDQVEAGDARRSEPTLPPRIRRGEPVCRACRRARAGQCARCRRRRYRSSGDSGWGHGGHLP